MIPLLVDQRSHLEPLLRRAHEAAVASGDPQVPKRFEEAVFTLLQVSHAHQLNIIVYRPGAAL